LIWHDENPEPKSRKSDLAMLLLAPFLITLALAGADIYPYGGTRHDVLLIVFAIPAIAIGLDRLPWHGSKTTLVKGLLLASAMLICNFFPSPSGPYIRPHDQRRELMLQAISAVRSLPPDSVLLSDAQGSMVLNYYFCEDGMDLPFTPERRSLKLHCGNYYVVTSMAAQTGFDRDRFPGSLTSAWQENPKATTIYLFQSGWIDDKEEAWLTELRGLGGNPRNFGPNILLCPFAAKIRRSTPD